MSKFDLIKATFEIYFNILIDSKNDILKDLDYNLKQKK